MKKSILFIGALMLLATSCVKEKNYNETYRPVGTPIVFGAATGYENGDGTRTEYSGQLYGTTTQYERINWVANDKLTIFYGNDNGQYKISGSPTATNEISEAGVAHETGTELTWSARDNHVFYAMYPANSTNGSITAAGHVTGTIPATQTVTESGSKFLPNMNFGYLVSRKTISSNSTESTVSLPFTPAYTAFEFRLSKSGAAPVTVTKFELESTAALVGKFDFDITGENSRGATWGTVTPSSTGTKITVNLTKTLSAATDVLDVTVFALPTSITGLTVKLTYSNGTVKSLPLKDDATTFHTFDPCKKYVISNGELPSQWIYTVEPIDDYVSYGHLAATYPFEVKSYRTSSDGSVTQAVTWKAQYSVDGTTWTDTPPAGSAIEDFTVVSATGNGVATPATSSESRRVDLVENTHYTSTGTHTSTEILQGKTAVSNYDLSLHDVHGGTIAQSTANTYVVSAPGTYRFPCVYGNAIKGGATNTPAFNPGGSTAVWKSGGSLNGVSCPQYNQLYSAALAYPDVQLLPNFRNAYNTGIIKPYVVEDLNDNSLIPGTVTGLSAAVIWQDEEILTSSPSLITVDGHQYIEFTINATDIKPGNIVIALRGSIGVLASNSILWSWQIWVTEKDLHASGGWMPYNLGWNVDGYVQTRAYTTRICYVRIQQLVPSDDPGANVDHKDFRFEQDADTAETLERNIGSNPFYQWGRKDPIIPGQYSTTVNEIGEYCEDKPVYAGAGYTVNHHTKNPNAGSPSGGEYGRGVRNPHVAYIHSFENANGGVTGWVGGPVPDGNWNVSSKIDNAVAYNLWDASLISSPNGAGDSGAYKTKTVYDPCPVGFTVPYQGKFSALGEGTETNEGGRLYGTLFLPYAGARIFYNMQAWGTGPNGEQYSTANPGPAITPALYLRHINDFGLYWTDAPYNNKLHSAQIFIFDRVANDTDMIAYTRGTAAAIRPMVDPRW